MTTVEEIQSAVVSLPLDKYRQFRDWFIELDWEQWDRQVQADAEAGELDFLVAEAMHEKRHGNRKSMVRQDRFRLSSFGCP